MKNNVVLILFISLIIFPLESVCLAGMYKCVNEAGGLAFSGNGQCPDGYKLLTESISNEQYNDRKEEKVYDKEWLELKTASEKKSIEKQIKYHEGRLNSNDKEHAKLSLYEYKRKLEQLLKNPEEYFLSNGVTSP